MRVHTRYPVPGRTRAHSPSDGFVIGEGLAGARIHSANGQIVHGAGSGRGNVIGKRLSERAQQHVDNSLGGFDIATSHGRGWPGVDNRSRRSNYLYGPHQTYGCRNILRQEATENIEARRVGDSFHSVDAALYLRVCAGEIYADHVDCPTAALGLRGRMKFDADRDFHRPVAYAIVVQEVLGAEFPSRSLAQKRSHHLFRVIEQLPAQPFCLRQAVPSAYLAEAYCPSVARSNLGTQITFTFFGRAHVV